MLNFSKPYVMDILTLKVSNVTCKERNLMFEYRTSSDACFLQTKLQGLYLCHRLIIMLEILFCCGHKIEPSFNHFVLNIT